MTSDSEPSVLRDSPVVNVEADRLQPLTVMNLADREDAEKAIHFVTSPVGDQPLYLLPMVTTDELDDLHNLERPSSRQEVVHAKEATTFVVTAQDSFGSDLLDLIPQAESLTNQHLAVEGDKVAAPIPIPTLSREYICLCLCLPNHHVGVRLPVAAHCGPDLMWIYSRVSCRLLWDV